MDNKRYLDKVINKLVSETRVDDYETRVDDYERKIYFPFLSLSSSPFHLFLPFLPFSFISHCKEVYGLNEQETEYVWDEYKEIIKDKINKKG